MALIECPAIGKVPGSRDRDPTALERPRSSVPKQTAGAYAVVTTMLGAFQHCDGFCQEDIRALTWFFELDAKCANCFNSSANRVAGHSNSCGGFRGGLDRGVLNHPRSFPPLALFCSVYKVRPTALRFVAEKVNEAVTIHEGRHDFVIEDEDYEPMLAVDLDCHLN